MQPTQSIDWRGFHHLALVTPDLDATIQFYRDVLGMQAGEIRSEQHGVEATPTGTIGPIENMLFLDIHGVLLEATWPRPSE